MNWLRLSLVAALAVGLAAGEATAQQRQRTPASISEKQAAEAQAGSLKREGAYWVQEESGTIPAGSRLQIISSQGGIELRGGSQQAVIYRVRRRVAALTEEVAKLMLARYPVQVRRGGDLVYLAFMGPARVATDFFVVAPKGLIGADLQTEAGGVLAEDIAGAVHVQTGGGAIEVDNIGGGADLLTAGGPIVMGTIGGPVRAQTLGGDVRLSSAGGDVFITTEAGGIDIGKVLRSVQAHTGGGEIHIVRAGGNVLAQSAGGHIIIGEAGGIHALTAGGVIRIDKALSGVTAETGIGAINVLDCLGPVRAQSAAGSITAHITASRKAWSQSFLHTNIGDIKVFLPADLALTIQAAIAAANRNQGIHSDFPLNMRGGQAFGPRGILGEGTINGGGPQLQLRTTSGNIEIRSQR